MSDIEKSSVPGVATVPEQSLVDLTSEKPKVKFELESLPSSGPGEFKTEENAGGVLSPDEQSKLVKELGLKPALKPSRIIQDEESDVPIADVESYGGLSEPAASSEQSSGPSIETKEEKKDAAGTPALLGISYIPKLTDEDLGFKPLERTNPSFDSEDEDDPEYDPVGVVSAALGFSRPKKQEKKDQKNLDDLTTRNVVSEKAPPKKDFEKEDFGKGLTRSARYESDKIDYSITKINLTNRRVPGEAVGVTGVVNSSTMGYGRIKYDDLPLIARVEVIGGVVPVQVLSLNDLYPPKDYVRKIAVVSHDVLVESNDI